LFGEVGTTFIPGQWDGVELLTGRYIKGRINQAGVYEDGGYWFSWASYAVKGYHGLLVFGPFPFRINRLGVRLIARMKVI
jgi:hypothetical protein